MKITKIADVSGQNKKDISKLRGDLKSTDSDLKKLQNDFKKLQREINDLNIGNRRFWQQQTVFTSLQRKMERFEKIEDEWKKYKDSMDKKIKSIVEKRTRSTPQ